MELKKVRAICRQSGLEDLRRIKGKLSQAILNGSLEGTNALEALKEVDRALAKRELEALFKEALFK